MKEKTKEIIGIISTITIFIVIFAICSHIGNRGIEYAKNYNPTQIRTETPTKTIAVIGDDVDTLEIYEDKILVKCNGEVNAELLRVSENLYYGIGGQIYEVCKVNSCQYDADGNTTFCVQADKNPNMEILYSVLDNADEDTNFVLLRKGKTISDNVVVAYGRR